MSSLKSQLPIFLNNCSQESLLNYFQNTWELEDILLKTIIDDETFSINPDPLRNPLIFYLGHSAAFYINKLIRVELLEKPPGWQYAPSQGIPNKNNMILVEGGTIKLGKAKDNPLYGWDCEYGDRLVKVEPFFASQYLITNAEFLEFVNSKGYENQAYWDKNSWRWKEENNIKHPKFW